MDRNQMSGYMLLHLSPRGFVGSRRKAVLQGNRIWHCPNSNGSLLQSPLPVVLEPRRDMNACLSE